MAMTTGKMKVFVESADGTVYNLDGVATDISVSYHNDLIDVGDYLEPYKTILGMQSISFDIHGICEHDIFTTDQLQTMRTSAEWKCTYCGRPNARADETCESCGAVRSFLYG